MKRPVQVAITGAAGQIGYALMFRIAAGEMLGPDHPVRLRLLDIPAMVEKLQGTIMELEDCAFPLLDTDILATADPKEAFDGVDWGLFVGAMPRTGDMTRADLIRKNGPIFTEQGRALNAVASPDVRALVVGNPCNTNCLIAKSHAPNIPADRWYAMTRLDQNRATFQLAKKAGVPTAQVTNVTIWGNHSDTQFPDFAHARIGGRPAKEVIGHHAWFKDEFIPTVAKRGGAVIKARGASSAASAANAAIDSVKSVVQPTLPGQWFSAAVVSDGSYGVPKGLVCSFPLRSDGRTWSIIQGLEHDAFAQEKLKATVEELESERDKVRDLLGPNA